MNTLKRFRVFLVLALAAIVLFTACKKDDVAETTVQKMQHKWNHEKTYFRTVVPGIPDNKDTTIAFSGDYYDFRTDNKLYRAINGGTQPVDTVSYAVINDSTFIIRGTDTARIKQLTNNLFEFEARNYASSTIYLDYHVFLNR